MEGEWEERRKFLSRDAALLLGFLWERGVIILAVSLLNEKRTKSHFGGMGTGLRGLLPLWIMAA